MAPLSKFSGVQTESIEPMIMDLNVHNKCRFMFIVSVNDCYRELIMRKIP
jgi:hypothetical protein